MTRSRPSWALLLLAAAVAAVWSHEVPSAVEATVLRDYPETWQVASRDVASFSRVIAISDSQRSAAGLLSIAPTAADLEFTIRRAGASAVRAAMRARIEWDSRGFLAIPATGIDWMPSATSPSLEPALRAVARPEDDAFLVRVMRDTTLSPFVRLLAVQVLCRRGNAAAVAPVTALVLDSRSSLVVPGHFLCELPRTGLPLPVDLDALLEQPAQSLDVAAACVLGAHGTGLEAPTLVARAFRGPLVCVAPHTPAAIAAVRRAAGADPDVAAALTALDEELANSKAGHASYRQLRFGIHAVGERFTDWLTRHPEALDTAWERARLADAESPRRRRSREIRAALWPDGRGMHASDPEDPATRTPDPVRAADLERAIDLVLATPDELLDVAVVGPDLAGLGNPDFDGNLGETAAADLDRIARRIRGDVDRAATPAAKLGVLAAALVVREVQAPGRLGDTAASAVRAQTATCVGWTLAFTGVADRLGLPIRAVSVPGHVFVCWDDGATRIHIDPSHECATWSDDEIVRRFGIPDTPAARAAHLRPLSRRETIAISLTNAAFAQLDESPDSAATMAAAAVRLDPASLPARLAEGMVAARRGDAGAVRSAVAACEALPTISPSTAATAALALSEAGDDVAALALLERHPPGETDRAAHGRSRVAALLGAGRSEDAWTVARDLLAAAPDEPGTVALAVRAALLTGGTARADETLAAAVRRGGDAGLLVCTTAAHLIEARPLSRRAARYAVAVLTRRDAGGRGRSLVDATSRVIDSPTMNWMQDFLLARHADETKSQAQALADDTSLPEDP